MAVVAESTLGDVGRDVHADWKWVSMTAAKEGQYKLVQPMQACGDLVRYIASANNEGAPVKVVKCDGIAMCSTRFEE